jgi:hypothetical protein
MRFTSASSWRGRRSGAEEMAIISGGDVLALLPGEEVAAA